jgi:hypothetical protein
MNMDRWPKRALYWIPPGRQKLGRPRCRWTQETEEAMMARNLEEGKWQDRKTWGLGTKKQ